MTTMKADPAAAAGSEFVTSRVVDAPRDLVYRAWTEEQRLRRWWGPKGVTIAECRNDPRPGGLLHYLMRTEDGQDMWGRWVYREIAPNERLVIDGGFSDEHARPARHPMAPDWPLEMRSVIEFADDGPRTKITVRSSAPEATDAERRSFEAGHDAMREGWSGTFDRLEAYLAQAAAETPQPPFAKPQREHEWLQQLVGEWTYEMDMPGQPGQKCTGTETVRSRGGLWITAEGRGQMPGGGEASMALTVGYDPARGRYVGTWIGSMMTHLWQYEGWLDAGGKVLTLKAEGPNCMAPGTTAKFRDIIEIVDENERIFRGTIQGEDGEWTEMMRVRYRRVGAEAARPVRAIDLLRSALADEWFISLAQELRDAPLTFPTPSGGNHPLWTVGHVAVSEAEMMRMAFGGENPLADWDRLFGRNTEPTDDPAAYPPFDEVVARFREVRARTLQLLEETGEDGLSRAPQSTMEGAGHWFDSLGHLFHFAVIHMMSHHGQLADARRARGMPPRF